VGGGGGGGSKEVGLSGTTFLETFSCKIGGKENWCLSAPAELTQADHGVRVGELRTAKVRLKMGPGIRIGKYEGGSSSLQKKS